MRAKKRNKNSLFIIQTKKYLMSASLLSIMTYCEHISFVPAQFQLIIAINSVRIPDRRYIDQFVEICLD